MSGLQLALGYFWADDPQIQAAGDGAGILLQYFLEINHAHGYAGDLPLREVCTSQLTKRLKRTRKVIRAWMESGKAAGLFADDGLGGLMITWQSFTESQSVLLNRRSMVRLGPPIIQYKEIQTSTPPVDNSSPANWREHAAALVEEIHPHFRGMVRKELHRKYPYKHESLRKGA